MEEMFRSAFVRGLIENVVLLPAAVVVFCGWGLLRFTRAAPDRRGALWAAGLAGGFFASYAVTYHDFSVPPRTVLSWLPWLVVGAAVAVALVARRANMVWIAGVRLTAVAVSAYVLLRPLLHQEPWSTAFISWFGTAVVWFALWSALALPHVDQKAGGVALCVVAAALALAAPLSGSIEIGRFGGALATALGVSLVFPVFVRDRRWDSPTGDVPVMILGALMVDLRFYAGAPWVVMAWLTAALVTASLAIGWIRSRRNTAQWGIIVAGVAALLPAALACWTAWRVYQQSGGY